MADLRTELIDFVRASSLSEDDKDLWIGAINLTSTDLFINDILDLVSREPERLVFLTVNLKEKTNAVKTYDHNLWMDIIKKERAFLHGEQI